MNSRRNFLQKMSLACLTTPAWKDVEINRIATVSGDHDWEQIRAQFPLEKAKIYFNNGTFGPSPELVLNAIKESFARTNQTGEYGNPGSGREQIAAFFGVEEREISLTHNTTEGINIMAQGLPLKAGDEVIVTSHEHAGNAIPWLNRSHLDGINLRVFEPMNTQEKNFEQIKSLISARTKVIAIPHITCTTGTVFPIQQISAFARSKGIWTAIDGAHGAGTLELNLKDLGCDFYAGCFHKWMLGPNGSGFLYVKSEMLDTLQAYHVGAKSEKSWVLTEEEVRFDGYRDSAHRYDYGTQSTPLHLGVLAALEFHEQVGRARIEARIRELNEYLFSALERIAGLQILTPKEKLSRISMVTFTVPGRDFRDIATALGRKKIRIRGVHEAGLNAIRVSTHIYNSQTEVDYLVKELTKII